MSKKPTLKTISNLSGLAVPTVSRALSDAPDISAATKKKIRKIADEIGYIPNRAGVRLRTGRTNVVSLVLATDHDALNITSRLISSIAGGLRNTPYHLVVTPDFPDDDPLKAIKYIVETGSADAIIINRIEPKDPRVAYMMEKGFPFATHGRTVWSDKHAYFDYDNNKLARIAVRMLKNRGRKKILMIAPPLNQSYAQDIVAGARAAAQECGVKLIVSGQITSDSHRDIIKENVRKLVQTDPTYDGIFAGSPNSTMAAIAGLEAAGLEISENFDVFSKENAPFLSMFRPGILVKREDISVAGEFLARAAVHAAKSPSAVPMQYLDVPKED